MTRSGQFPAAQVPRTSSVRPGAPPHFPTASPQPPLTPNSATAPLAAWLLIQAVALLLAATRIPLSAHYMKAGERLAVYLLLATQIGGSAMLFPWLLCGRKAAAAVAVTAWPFLAVAATF